MHGRETRFTAEVLEEAARRLNRLKDEVADSGFLSSNSADTVQQLGWSVMAVADMADDECSQVTRLIPSGDRQVVAAFVDGLLLGGICTDITYERAHGLHEVTRASE